MGIERFTPCKHNWKYPDCPFCVMDERMDALEEMIQNLYDEISEIGCDCKKTEERDEDGITLDA